MLEDEIDPLDPRMQINGVIQGTDGGLSIIEADEATDLLEDDE
jgi:hypothetical protein